MVAKPATLIVRRSNGYLLAKIHMVAKRKEPLDDNNVGYLLAKIHMVAKPT